MKPDRLNALTDGVVAIVLTIMVLELKFPAEPTLRAALAVLPLLAAYLLAFGVVMLLCALSVALLRSALLAANEPDAPIAKVAARGRKGQITIAAYVVAIGVAFVWPMVAVALYFAVALLWIIPDRRFEKLAE